MSIILIEINEEKSSFSRIIRQPFTARLPEYTIKLTLKITVKSREVELSRVLGKFRLEAFIRSAVYYKIIAKNFEFIAILSNLLVDFLVSFPNSSI